MAFSSLKGTRKTYSFEERELLITLINKYEDVEDKKADPVSMRKRKSAWFQLAEEYNSTVGPQGARSAVQLRRCWENMKACKRNREEKKSRTVTKNIHHASKDHGYKGGVADGWENGICGSASEVPKATGTVVGLPPNIVFEPNDSEPFTLQSVCPAKPPKFHTKKEPNAQRDSGIGSSSNASMNAEPSAQPENVPPMYGSASDCVERSARELFDSPMELAERSEEEELFTNNNRPNAKDIGMMARERPRKPKKSAQREEELHALALSEARMKVDTATMLKEEARIKLEEAHYRKEEARLRMVFITYKLDTIKQD